MSTAGDPALVTAASARDLDAVRRLLAEGADVDACTANGHTALMWAARHDDLAMTAALIEAGAQIDRGDKRGWTALAWAAFDDALAGLSAMLEAGASPSASRSSALHVALMRGHVRMVERLVDAGADLSAMDSNERTPLEHAAYFGQPALVAAVLRRDNPQLARDRALVEAAAHGHLRVAEMLLDAGADPSFETARGNAALGVARKRRRTKVVALLVARGATVAKTASAKRAVPAPPVVRDRAPGSTKRARGAPDALVTQLKSTAAAKRRSAAKKMGATGDAAFEGVLVAALAHELEDKRAWEGQREMARALGAVSADATVAAWLLSVFVEVRFESTVVPQALAGAALRIGHRGGKPELDRLLARVLDDVPAKDEQLAACSGILEAAAEVELAVGAKVGRRLAAFLDDPGELPRYGEVMLQHARKAWGARSKT